MTDSSAIKQPVSDGESAAGVTPKTLFVPLRGVWFDRFESGEKAVEYRAYGPRWNEQTCFPGRPVVLSRGYSGRRLHGHVTWTSIMNREKVPSEAQEIYPNAALIIAIGVTLAPAVKPDTAKKGERG